jgi:MoxR-like ATPase
MDYVEIEKLTDRVKKEKTILESLKNEIRKVIIGQESLIDRILVAFLSDGHILLEGLPGLAKTLTVRSFARTIDADFQRIQFTPDLLPADLIGTQIYDPKKMDFFTKQGPIFTNILLADEINRAPAKVQSALLQAMEEKHVTIGAHTYALHKSFMVLATENPIEQEGTYPLPEAQLDRFFMKCLVEYPAKDEEYEIVKRYGSLDTEQVNPVLTAGNIDNLKKTIDSIYIDEKLVEYIVHIVIETRKPNDAYLKQMLEFGASPRASIALMKAAKCIAFMHSRGFVTPDDIKEIGADVLRHRIILSYEAEAEELSTDDMVQKIFDSVEVP